MKTETFSASAKINVRASDPEIKQRNEFWILWVKNSISSSIWFICPNCWQYALHAWISQEHVLIIFHICMYVKQWRVCFCTIDFCYKFLSSKFATVSVFPPNLLYRITLLQWSHENIKTKLNVFIHHASMLYYLYKHSKTFWYYENKE